MPTLELSFASGESSLSVRRFAAHESISSLFTLSVWARSKSDTIDLEGLVGKDASLRVVSGYAWALNGGTRAWSGICSYVEQVQAEPTGLSTYYFRIVPKLWLLTQRTNYRIYQHLSIPDILDKLLAEWSITPAWQIDRGSYPKLEYKVQYGESDFDFVNRLLEEAGIAFTFPDNDGKTSPLTFSDKLQAGEARAGAPIHFVENPSQAAEQEFITNVRMAHAVKPGATTFRDHDFRNPAFQLFGDAPKAGGPEDMYEQYKYHPGSFLVEGAKGGDTPSADDKGVARYEQKYGKELAERRLQATRADKRSVSFDTNAADLRPGRIFSMDRHPHGALDAGKKLMVSEFTVEGSPDDEWIMSGRALFTDPAVPYRPPVKTSKPTVHGMQSAIIVGPGGQEIHTDEFGRVRVQFPWDREGKNDDNSSCWIRVSQGWGGTGYGLMVIPRIGQEVLIGFLGGDPDQPIIVGRIYNATQQVPYKLPQHKTRSTWKSDSSIGGGGFNEIMFEDLKGKELVWQQAQKNQRRLVKNDEVITVGNDRQKLVKRNETETTLADRVEVTEQNRTEITDAKRTVMIGGTLDKLVKGAETRRTVGDLARKVDASEDIVIGAVKKERVGKTSHLIVGEELHERIGAKHAVEVGREIHIRSGDKIVIEAGAELTIRGPAGFVKLDSSGVIIKGQLVRINSGGEPGEGSGAKPEPARDAQPPEPPKPTPDDVSKTGIAQ
ncbi:MAG TPA: type VI secretion system tip protein TssI/VgrG [Polyangiaceae bacterium]|nr:type VI secretion system tip protein TssI/VgrG [Polyangiaceae bacterium]